MKRQTALALAGLAMTAMSMRHAPAADAPDVAASVRPIHSLVVAVMEGVGDPFLIVRGGGSPHAYSLRPSEAEALQDAELVVWVGESMETFLAGAIGTLAPDAHVLTLIEAPGVTVLAPGENGAWEKEEQDDREYDDEQGDEHGHDGVDGHIWLDPENAKAIVAAVVKALVEIDPVHADAYRVNGGRVTADIDDLSASVARRVAPVADRPYIVFHDGYRYFERYFGTNPVGSVAVSPEKQPGAARVADIRQRLTDKDVVCVFREPQTSPRLIETIVEGTDVKVGVLDPLGIDIEAGADHYHWLMMAIADGLHDCLAD